jgi:hypothetical protein
MGSRGHKLTNVPKTTFYKPVEPDFFVEKRWIGTTGSSFIGLLIEDSFPCRIQSITQLLLRSALSVSDSRYAQYLMLFCVLVLFGSASDTFCHLPPISSVFRSWYLLSPDIWDSPGPARGFQSNAGNSLCGFKQATTLPSLFCPSLATPYRVYSAIWSRLKAG